jgi:hypothetical protein
VNDASRARSRDIVELSIGYALIVIAVWTPLPVQRVLFWVAFSWIMSTTLLSRDDRDSLGLGLCGIRRSLWIVGIALALAIIDLLISLRYSALHPLYGPVPFGRHVWGYVIWAFLQQFVLQDFFLLRLMRLLPTRTAAIFTAAALFSIAHLPNPLLSVATLVWGLAACAIFLKYRSLYVLGLVHGILGLSIAVSVPNAVHRHMRVGLGYLRYNTEQRAAAADPVSPAQPSTVSPASSGPLHAR